MPEPLQQEINEVSKYLAMDLEGIKSYFLTIF